MYSLETNSEVLNLKQIQIYTLPIVQLTIPHAN